MLFVLNSLAVGGSEIKIIKVANAMARAGMPVKLAYLDDRRSASDKVDSEVPTVHLGRRGKYSIGSLQMLRGLIGNDTRAVVAVNQYPLLYVIPAIKLAKAKDVKAIGLVNTSEVMGTDMLIRGVYAPLLRRCEQVVFGCVAQQALWAERYRVPPERARVIYNGVDHAFYSPANGAEEGVALRNRLRIPDGAVVIGSIGRLAPEKSFDLLIGAVSRLHAAGRDTYAIIAGTGAEKARLEGLAAERGVADKVLFLGALEDVRPAISLMDVFVLPSTAVETFSNAALEAMAMARAVVLSDIGGAAEMVQHGKSGMLFPTGDLDTLTSVLAELHASAEMRRSLGLAARERVVDSFGFADMVDGYAKLLSPLER